MVALPYTFTYSADPDAAMNRLLADARSELPGAIPASISAALFATLKDFCDRTNVWQEDIDVTLVANVASYTLTPLGNGKITRLINLYNSQDPDKRWVGRCSMQQPGALLLYQAPATSGQVFVATVAKTPVDPLSADGLANIDQWIIEKYWDTLKAGTLARMMMQPAKTYTNIQLAGVQMKIYTSGRSVAHDEVVKANVFGQTNWKFPQTMGVSRQRGM